MWPFRVSDASLQAGVHNASAVVHPTHPYFPLGIEVPGYAENDWSVPTLLTLFCLCCAGPFTLAYLIVSRIRPNLPTSELLTLLWFVLCGCIHSFFEGYYVYNFRAMGGLQDLFGQLWKEYALSDSRYLTKDPFVLCMEAITAVFWGPLSFVVAYTIITDHPLRHPLQIIVSLGQLYGDVLYYATSTFDHLIANIAYYRPEPYYFWCYYVLMNAFWIVFPLCLIFSSVKASGKAFRVLAKSEKPPKANRETKKTK